MPAAIMATTEKSTSIEPHALSDSQSPASIDSSSKKRPSTSAGLDKDGNPKPVKRRAAKACAACRARKVRCDVMQRYHITADGEVTCSNCTMDGIKCVIEESKRRKKHLSNGEPVAGTPVPQNTANGAAQGWRNGLVNPSDITNLEARRWSGSTAMSNDLAEMGHVPHQIYQNVNSQISKGEMLRRQSFIQTPFDAEPDITMSLLSSASMTGDRTVTRLESPAIPPPPMLKYKLPEYLKPLPQRMTSVDIDYLFAKGALSLPDVPTRNVLLRSYLEYVHPYMPLIEAYEVLQIIADGTGASGRMSLLLFQAIMFAGTAFVDMDMLRSAGYSNRKAARKAFFQKARVLYDFDYEVDRVSLVQSLLLMTYWYETPDDQKDTWHWMGVAISLAHTIGLHRNPEKSNMEPNKKKLWKRIWWSCFMRDRLVALGMRRPTRVKDEDYDVPMLTEDDFEIEMLPEGNPIIPDDCTLVRDVEAQRQLAQMCIAKAKLCLCISHVLSAQYSVLVRHQGMQGQEGSTRSSVMLFPKKLDQTDEVKHCDIELSDWINELPESCLYTNSLAPGSSGAPLFVQRSLLHMVYFTTLSALHRPQVLPSASTTHPDSSRELQDLSRKKVREASREITRISQNLHSRGLEKYLPTTGVTVLLPAIIIHLLDIKSCNDDARQAAMDGFCQCMLVLEKLRDNYSSADFATQFLEAAIRKADIDVVMSSSREKIRHEDVQAALGSGKAKELLQRSRASRRTPPPSGEDAMARPETQGSGMVDIVIPAARQEQDHIHNAISARTPPETDGSFASASNSNSHEQQQNTFNHMTNAEFNVVYPTNEVDLNDFLNFDTGNEMWNVPLEEEAVTNDLLDFSTKLQRSSRLQGADGIRTKNEIAIQQLCCECNNVATQLLERLRKLRPTITPPERPPKNSLRKDEQLWQETVRGVRKNIKEWAIVYPRMKPLLKTFRDQAESLSIKQTERFEKLNRETRDIVGAILDNIYSNISHDIKLQTEAIAQILNRGEVAITDSATADCRVIDTNTIARKAEPNIGVQNLEILAELRQKGVAEAHKRTPLWLYESEGLNSSDWDSFTSWLEHGDGLYWINGKAGSGKSTLMKFICNSERTREYLSRWAPGLNLCVAEFYFWNLGSKLQKSQVGLLRSLLCQILQQMPTLTPLIFPKVWAAKYTYRSLKIEVPFLAGSWSLSSLSDAWNKMIELIGQDSRNARLAIFIDGLDEYEGLDADMARLFEATADSLYVKVCASSRAHVIFENSFATRPSLRLQDLTHNDIQAYVEDRLLNNEYMQGLLESEPLQTRDLVEEIVAAADGVFLWVHLVVQSLLAGLGNCDEIHDLRCQHIGQRLKSRTVGLLEVQKGARKDIHPTMKVQYLHRTVRGFLMTPEIQDILQIEADFDPSYAILKGTVYELQTIFQDQIIDPGLNPLYKIALVYARRMQYRTHNHSTTLLIDALHTKILIEGRKTIPEGHKLYEKFMTIAVQWDLHSYVQEKLTSRLWCASPRKIIALIYWALGPESIVSPFMIWKLLSTEKIFEPHGQRGDNYRSDIFQKVVRVLDRRDHFSHPHLVAQKDPMLVWGDVLRYLLKPGAQFDIDSTSLKPSKVTGTRFALFPIVRDELQQRLALIKFQNVTLVPKIASLFMDCAMLFFMSYCRKECDTGS
ncbi:hypothetical protein G7Y89_g3578 [Cudoniella acicularis]|uniref:Zn(2)-C6 fungal-type domain-containing protein n=1 Tax=Cudoniella acicularis TaxID=354080 RepID=A0A8H4W5T8_9HELO|nr:hypothetical protein G7Y89_g3578 [Cudoniella acicularis]